MAKTNEIKYYGVTYSRVSSVGQVTSGDSLDHQKKITNLRCLRLSLKKKSKSWFAE